MLRRRRTANAAAVALIALSVAALVHVAAPPDSTPAPSRPVLSAVTRAGDTQLSRLDRRVPPPRLQQVAVVPPGRRAVRVPILMYHYIRVNPDPRDKVGFGLSVTPADFVRQMDWLAANGYHPVDFDDLRGYLLGGGSLPDRPLVLTFDDGYRDLYTTAYPVLRAHRFKAVAYVPSGFVDSPASVTTEQVLEMDANGIQIGAHSVSHADLIRLSGADLWHEVHDSKVSLEALLGHPVLDFCYPYGHFNDGVVRAVQAAGYLTATTTQPGLVHAADDRLQWARVRVAGGESLEQLVADLGPPEAGELVVQAQPRPTPLHGPKGRPVTVPLLPPRPALPAAPPTEGALP